MWNTSKISKWPPFWGSGAFFKPGIVPEVESYTKIGHVIPYVLRFCSDVLAYRKWQDYVYIQCEYKSTKQKIKHLLREENKVKENKIS